MKILKIIVVSLLLTTNQAFAIENGVPPDDVITLSELAEKLEQKLKKPVVVDKNYAKNEVQIKLERALEDRGNLLTELSINGYTAIDTEDYIELIDVRRSRMSAIPVVDESKHYYPNQWVTKIITVEKACAYKILPIVRPLVPQYAHMAVTGEESLVISDRYANVQRLSSIIENIDKETKDKAGCNKKS